MDRSSIVWRGVVLILLSMLALAFRLGVLGLYDLASLVACVIIAVQIIILWVILRWRE